MAITYIQPGTPLETDLWDNIYGELDRKINLITNNKSIIFLETGLLSSKKYYFFDGIEGRVGDLLNQNISDCLGRRVPNGNVGWYGYLFNSNNTSGEYRHSVYESGLASVVLGSDSITGCYATYTGLSESLAVPRGQSFYRVTGINIINSGSGYGEFTYLSFPPKPGFGPYFTAKCGALTDGRYPNFGSGAITGFNFAPPLDELGYPTMDRPAEEVSNGVYFGSGPDTIEINPVNGSGTGFLGIPLLENVNANIKFVNPYLADGYGKLFQVELIFEGNSMFTFPKEYDKYKFFRIHNLNNSSLNFTFESGAPPGSGMDTSAGEQFSITIPKHSSRCVRRDFGRYTLGYVNFQKIISGDGRFDDDFPDAFNNVYDPIDHALSYLNHNSISSRCTFNKTKYWNSESLYFGEGKPFKEKNDDTLYGDILYHTGDILMTHVYTGNFCSRPGQPLGGSIGDRGREYTPSGYFETKIISYSGGQFPLEQFLAQSGLSGIKSSDKFCLTYTGTGTNCSGDFRQTRFIKTKVHLLQNTTDFYTLCGTSGIDQGLVQAQIDVLNNAFSAYNNPNPYIQFEWDQNLIITNFTGVAASGSPPSSLGTWPGVLANGDGNPPPANYDEFQTISPAINPDNFLNIWIFECTGEGCTSFANYPDTHGAPWDGVSMKAGNFFLNPCQPGSESGHILIHEVGHYLGLPHLWAGHDRPGQTDDGISDTPNQDGPIYGCPKPPPFASDGVTRALTNNYMNYTDCTNSFTSGQVDRMNATLDVVRNSLFSGFCTGQYAMFALKETVFTPYTTNIISTQNIGTKKILKNGTTNVCVTTGSDFISSGTYFIMGEDGMRGSFLTYGVVPFRTGAASLGLLSRYSGPLIAASTYSFPKDVNLSYVSGKMMDYFSINQAQLEATGQWLEDDITQRLSGNYKFLGSELINHGFSNLILHRSGGLALNVVGGVGFPIFTFLKSNGFHLENDVIYSLEDSYTLSSSDWRSHSPRTDEYYGVAPSNNYLFARVHECEPTPPPTKPGFPIDRAKKIYLMRNYHGGFPIDGARLFSLNFFLESQGGIERCVYLQDPGYSSLQWLTDNHFNS